MTRASRNLKGTSVKKQAVVMAAATLEVLRTHADYPNDSVVPRQLRALKEELEKPKCEAKRANEEATKLRAEWKSGRIKKEELGRLE